MIVDDSLTRLIWNIDNFVENFFELFCFWCVNLWIIDFSLLVHWRFVDDSMQKHWRYSKNFDANIEDHKCFQRPTLRNIDVSLLLPRRSLMILSRDVFRIVIFSMATFLIFIVFVVLTSESMMFHCFFVDDSLMTLWRTIDDTTKIWTQSFLINKDFIVQFFNFWYFIGAWLIDRFWWFFGETLMRLWWFRCRHQW